jgi:hypothetical protein
MRVCAWTQGLSDSGPPQQALDGRRVGDGILPTRRDSLYFRQNFERGQEGDHLLEELSCVENGSLTGVSDHAPCDATQHVRSRRAFLLRGLRETRSGYPWWSVSHLRELGVPVRSRCPGGTLARGLAVLLNMSVVISEVNRVDGVSYLRCRRTVRVVLPSGSHAAIQCDRRWRCWVEGCRLVCGSEECRTWR